MAGTISKTITTSYTLNADPATILATGGVLVDLPRGAAVVGPSGTAWTLINQGEISNIGSISDQGVNLYTGGNIQNTAGATIFGTDVGVLVGGEPGYVTNQAGGTISAVNTGIYLDGDGANTVKNSGTITAQEGGVAIVPTSSGSGYLQNSGQITATALYHYGPTAAVYIDNVAGTIVNTGTIAGGFAGIRMTSGSSGTVTNFGQITGIKAGIFAAEPTNVTNAGTISGTSGVYIKGAPGTVTNTGSITATGGPGTAVAGIALVAGGRITNAAGGVITATGADAIYGNGPTTITNFGTIRATGTGTNAIDIPGGRIISEAGGVFEGRVNGGGGTLELAAGTQTLTGIGSNYTNGTIFNFTNIQFDAGAAAKISGTGTGLNNQRFSGFTTGNTIEITGAAETISGFSSGTLTLGGDEIVTLNMGPGFALSDFQATQSGSNTDITITDRSLTMATTISSSGTVGVTVTTASQNPVLVSGTGTIDVAGAYASAIYANFGIAGSITNDGLLEAPNGYGVFLKSGGTITNGSTLAESAKITGGVVGVKIGIHGTGTINNFGTIASTGTAQGIGVQALANASVVNGSPADTSALISGYSDGVEILGSGATVSNFGTITATGTSTIIGSSSFGVYLAKGGTVTNGSATDTSASIQGALFSVEVAHGPGKVVNFGTIKTTGPLGRGILLEDGGSVTNNVAGYIGASNRTGVYIGGPGAGNVINLGKIHAARTGVAIETGGTVTNGSNADKTANIFGARSGVYIAGLLPAVVNNFGTIANAQAHPAVNLYLGGQVINGSTADLTALISGGGNGVYAGGPSRITNFGTISGGNGALGLRGGGMIVNGSATDKTAKIAATGTVGTHSGIYDNGGLTTITNFGTITSSTASGIHLNNGGSITNGSGADTVATILGATGHTGIYLQSGSVAVVNFGTIRGVTGLSFTNGTTSATGVVKNIGSIVSTSGTAGTAVKFGSGNDRLIISPGAVFVGKVFGDAGANVLELAAGVSAGSITGVGSQFSGFQHTVVDSSATWNVGGSNTIPTLTDNGTLGFNSNGTLVVTTAVDPASSGVFLLENKSVLEVAADKAANKMGFVTPSRLIVDTAANFGTNVGSTLYTGPLIESFGTGDSILLKNITAAGAVLNYSTASGLLQVTGSGIATLLFGNLSLGAGSFHVAADGSGHAIITHHS